MAVPKKRTSKSKKKIRNQVWKGKSIEEALKASSLARSVLTGRSKSFYYGITTEKRRSRTK
uniref:ribosomal protein L32 n=1 Tax=Lygodium flexuosum TaxID=85330 RepID=UPI002A80467C|nr:ribosomal protein L32 [Lygodium flexuosum]YP_010981947.1 ribosomal protein L32 [Lygodium merrillii]UYS92509.1 ribosomal protein L32 [Lygodium flexuosum]UYS92599.1 ribosomal protein L32 [Lygodium merrillii]